MKIECNSCGSSFTIPDEKIPENKAVFIACPKCRNKLTVGPLKKQTQEKEPPLDFDEQEAASPAVSFDEGDEVYDADEKPFDFIEEEGETAIICEFDPMIREKIKIALDLLEYSVSIAEGTRDALKKMRYHNYNLVIVNENFDTPNPDVNGVMIFLNRQPMVIRRLTTVFLLTDRFRTMDNMAAFHKSANVIVNVNDLEKFDIVIQKGITETEMFYRIYKEYTEKLV